MKKIILGFCFLLLCVMESGWGQEKKTEISRQVLDLSSVLLLAVQNNHLSDLNTESTQRFLLEVSSSYLDLFYFNRCYQILRNTEAQLKEFGSMEAVTDLESFSERCTESQIYLQELLNLVSSDTEALTFFIEPMLDDLDIAHDQILEQIQQWKKKGIPPSFLESLQKKLTEVALGQLLLQKENKSFQDKLEKTQKALKKQMLSGLRKWSSLQIQILLLQLDYKKLLLVFSWKTQTLLATLHLESYARILQNPPLLQLYHQLNQPLTKDQLLQVIQKLESLLAQSNCPKQEVYTLLSRSCYYLGTMFYTASHRAERLQFFKKGKEYGILGARENVAIAKALDREEPWQKVIKFMRFEDTPALYWMCGNWSRYGDAFGMSAATDAPTIHDIARTISYLNPFLDGSGCFRFLGVYYCRIPKVMGQDPQKALEYFQKAIRQSPGFLGNKL
ncbi:MAG: TRAP transporter TatT component family protein, partial [Planctomycetota bacterium]